MKSLAGKMHVKTSWTRTNSLRNLISYESILQALVNETALPEINTAVVRMLAKGM